MSESCENKYQDATKPKHRGIVIPLMLLSVALAGAVYMGAAYYSGAEQRKITQGWMAANNGDFETALTIFRPLAEQGNSLAQYNLAVMYNDGTGVSKDEGLAVEWFNKAAESGHDKAQFEVGRAYLAPNGRSGIDGIRQNRELGEKWLTASAKQGNEQAMLGLGLLYIDGNNQGYPKNYEVAGQWLTKAAEAGEPLAQRILGIFMREGRGVRQDYVKAYMWSSLGSMRSTTMEGRNTQSLERVAALMTPEQINEAKAMVKAWVKAHNS